VQVIDQDDHRPVGLLLSHDFQQPRSHGERRSRRAGAVRGQYRREAISGRSQQLVDDAEV
jgi:hypothetical protein